MTEQLNMTVTFMCSLCNQAGRNGRYAAPCARAQVCRCNQRPINQREGTAPAEKWRQSILSCFAGQIRDIVTRYSSCVAPLKWFPSWETEGNFSRRHKWTQGGLCVQIDSHVLRHTVTHAFNHTKTGKNKHGCIGRYKDGVHVDQILWKVRQSCETANVWRVLTWRLSGPELFASAPPLLMGRVIPEASCRLAISNIRTSPMFSERLTN